MSEEQNSNDSGDVEAVKEPTNVESAKEQAENKTDDVSEKPGYVAELEERIQNLSAIVGKLTNEKKREEKQQAEEPQKPVGEVQQYGELEERLKKMESRAKKQERAAKLSTIELSLVEAGASAALAKSQAEFFAFKLGDRLQVSDDDSGNINVSVLDTDGSNVVTVNDWAKAYVESDEGLYLKSSKKGPSVNNGGESSGQASKVKLSSAEYSKQFSEARKRGQEAADAFVATHSIS